MEIKDYTLLKFKCGACGEGQYYSKGEPIICPYCKETSGQVLVEVDQGR